LADIHQKSPAGASGEGGFAAGQMGAPGAGARRRASAGQNARGGGLFRHLRDRPMPNWGRIVKEIQAEKDVPGGDSAADKVRQKYLLNLHKLTGRNVICYYSGFLQKPTLEGVAISDEDKHGLMDCVGGIDRAKGLDLFLHTPGGNIAATNR